MKNILIMRHAKSDWDTSASDFERPLNKRGQLAAPAMATELLRRDKKPDFILASTASRVRQTVELLTNTMQYTHPIEWHQEFYEGNVDNILDALRNLPDHVQRPLVVAHNPTLEYVVSVLTQGNFYTEMPTAAVVSIIADITQWSQLEINVNKKEWRVRPRELGHED